MLSEHTFGTGELAINYGEGPASGPPMVLLHGATMRWQNFQSIIPHLTPDWHVYACDLRGHGRSGRVADRYRVVDYCADTIAFLHGRVAEPAIIVGASLSGLIALGVAAEAPEFVRALVLLEPGFKGRNTRLADMPNQYNWVSWVYDTITSPRSNAEMLERCRSMASAASEADLQEFADHMFGLDPDAVRVWMEDRAFEEYDLEGVMRQVQAPTLILYAGRREDSTVSAEDVELVRSTLPHGVMICVPDAGHMVYEEQTDVVLKQMRAFLHSI
jgi:pimeloyl-ACP methyl ester carboxylesterase